MNTASIKAGDVVLVDKRGRRFHALVKEREGRSFTVRPLDARINYHQATSNEIVGAWLANKQTRERGVAA